MKPRRLVVWLGLVLGIDVAGAWAQPAVTVEPAAVLVMPFDVTPGRVSFQQVSRAGTEPGGAALRTHWVYYAEDCRHLADVFIALTPDDSVVVDPTRLQGEVQSLDPPANVPVGPPVDLSGERGLVFVTARGPDGLPSEHLVGGWTIANLETSASFGSDAIGLSGDGQLPGPALRAGGRLTIQTFNPETLSDSLVVVFGVQVSETGIGPLPHASAALGGGRVCCDARFVDQLEIAMSLPSYCFGCAGFASIGAVGPASALPSLVPATTSVASAGMVQLVGCKSAAADGSVAPVGEGEGAQFLFAFHGQAVGPFGTVVSGKYDAEALIR